MYDAANQITLIAANSKKNVYTIKLTKRIKGVSFISFESIPYGSITSSVQITGPYENGSTASSAPLSGNFIIKCTDLQGIFY